MALQVLGIRTILNLREYHADDDLAPAGFNLYRVKNELINGGYGYHALFFSNIPEFIDNADIEAIRTAVLEQL